MVVFPSLEDIADRIDAIEEFRKKGKKRGEQSGWSLPPNDVY